MTVWLWVIVGVAAYLVLSVLVALACGAILGQVSSEVPELLEAELPASAPLGREVESLEDDASIEKETLAHHLTGHRSGR
jgi:hypothetical protein